MTEYIFTKTITAQEISNLITRILGLEAGELEISSGRVRLTFDPPLTQEQRQALSIRFEKMGYYLIERD